MERLGSPRSFRNGVAVQHHVRFRLNQLGAPNGDPQGEAVAEALRQGLENYVRREQIYPVQEYMLKISIHHSTGTHTWISSPILPLADWLNNREQTEAWLDKLAKQFNSSESFEASSGDFYAELLFFKNRQRGSGHRGKKGNPGTMSYEQILKKKHCTKFIFILDRDNASRALVTMQTRADGNPQYENIKKGRGQQSYLAHKLCKEAGVAEGPCGSEEMQQFQDHLGPQGNQIIVFEGQKGLIWFKDRAYNNAPKKICLLKIGNHFYGITSIPALLNRTYYCHHCEKGYCHETSEKHNCLGQNCSSCKRRNKRCPNFATFETPEVYCGDCNRLFYGQECYAAHKQRGKNICSELQVQPEEETCLRSSVLSQLQGNERCQSSLLHSTDRRRKRRNSVGSRFGGRGCRRD